MNGIALLVQAFPFVAALSIFFVGLFLFSRFRRRLLTITLIFAVVLTGVISGLISGRDFTLPADAASYVSVPGWWLLLSKALNAGMLFGSMAYLVSNLTLDAGRPRANILIYAYLLFFITNYVVSAIFGIFPTFDYRWLYPVVLFCAFSYRPDVSSGEFLKLCVIGILFTLLAGLAAIPLFPGKALQTDYPEALFSWLPVRMWGLASHPNSLGPAAGMAAMILIVKPMLGRLRWPFLAVSIVCLVLIQSKTAIAAAAAALLLVRGLPAFFSSISGGFNASADDRSRARATVSLLAFTGIAVMSISAAALYANGLPLLNDLGVSDNSGLMTLTGRSLIWDVTIQTWKQNIAFGYGPDLWSMAFRTKAGIAAAGQAHNQWIQTLGQSGLVGLAGLLIYVLVLIRLAIRFHRTTGGLSSMLVIFILLQTITEAPLRTSSVFDISFLKHFLVFGYLSCLLYENRFRAAEPPGR